MDRFDTWTFKLSDFYFDRVFPAQSKTRKRERERKRDLHRSVVECGAHLPRLVPCIGRAHDLCEKTSVTDEICLCHTCGLLLLLLLLLLPLVILLLLLFAIPDTDESVQQRVHMFVHRQVSRDILVIVHRQVVGLCQIRREVIFLLQQNKKKNLGLNKIKKIPLLPHSSLPPSLQFPTSW